MDLKLFVCSSLIFLNEEFGEFWYELKLTGVDSLPIELEPIEAELGKYAIQVIKLKNPLNEQVKFRTLISNSNYFGLENKQNEFITIEANDATDVNVVFIPAAIGYSDHYTMVTFFNEKLGNITYELKGVGLEPDYQDPINITSEIGQGQIVNINFRNTTDSAVYCDLNLIGINN